jgi:Ras-related protein Rab-18
MPATRTSTQQNEPISIKLLVLGTESVGKSSLLLRFTDERWLPEGEKIPTIGVDTLVNICSEAEETRRRSHFLQVHKMDVKGNHVVLNIWVCVGPFRGL